MAEDRTVKIGTQKIDIKSCEMHKKSPQEGAWLWSRSISKFIYCIFQLFRLPTLTRRLSRFMLTFRRAMILIQLYCKCMHVLFFAPGQVSFLIVFALSQVKSFCSHQVDLSRFLVILHPVQVSFQQIKSPPGLNSLTIFFLF